jgi:ABC-type multidrug transport system permease subunit
MAQILEAGMVICFGISWPVNIAKSIKSKTAKGKSLVFLLFVLFGYICAICGKIISDNINWVFWFYVVNMIMVSLDIVMYFINRKRDMA